MKKKSIIAVSLALVMSLSSLTGCGQQTPKNANKQSEITSGGVLVVSVNPEIAVEYDEKGIVTKVTARNDDGSEILANCKDLVGKETRNVVTTLVTSIGEAGYFAEDIESEKRQISIEIEKGSKLPHKTFLDEVVSDVRDFVNSNGWGVPLDVENESDYGISNYVDTDYGPDNDGVTDYDDTDYGPNNDGVTDYNDTDYGPNNDGVTDYSDTDDDYDDDYDDDDYDDDDYDDDDDDDYDDDDDDDDYDD